MSIVFAIAAIMMWASLALLSVRLAHIPPLFLTGACLLVGGLVSVPWARMWTLRWPPIVLGSASMLLYHLFYMVALREAPAVSANLVHYIWPMLIVLLTPVVTTHMKLRAAHVVSAILGFGGAALAILNGTTPDTFARGYFWAAAAALVWSTYSLTLARMKQVSVTTTGLACLIAGMVALFLHAVLEPRVELSATDVVWVSVLGLGPMGLAFYLWAGAMREGDPRVIGALANATPVLSTAMLAVTGLGEMNSSLWVAAMLVACASLIALRSREAAGKRP